MPSRLLQKSSGDFVEEHSSQHLASHSGGGGSMNKLRDLAIIREEPAYELPGPDQSCKLVQNLAAFRRPSNVMSIDNQSINPKGI